VPEGVGLGGASFISSMKRVGQPLQVRLLIDDLFSQDGLDSVIAVCGDFNSTADEVPVWRIWDS